jgi:hypothetical protein
LTVRTHSGVGFLVQREALRSTDDRAA